MSRTELDGLAWLDTSYLKKMGYLYGYRSGTLTWTRQPSGDKSSIGVEVFPVTEPPYIRVNYTTTDYYSNEKKSYDYKVLFETTHCNYGGKRYWLICPLRSNGVYCGRRVRRLYMYSGYFGCRTCLKLVYPSQNENPAYRHGVYRILSNQTKAEEILETIKVPYYKGKPTRKMRRYLRLQPSDEVVNTAWMMLDEELRRGV